MSQTSYITRKGLACCHSQLIIMSPSSFSITDYPREPKVDVRNINSAYPKHQEKTNRRNYKRKFHGKENEVSLQKEQLKALN